MSTTLKNDIYQFRVKHGMSERQFAETVNVSQQTIYFIGIGKPITQFTEDKIRFAMSEYEKKGGR